MVGLDGGESRNRTELGSCRQYQAESNLSFEEQPPLTSSSVPEKKEEPTPAVPQRLTMEVSLESDIELDAAAVGDRVRAVLVRPLKNAERILAAEGSVVVGNIVRLEKQGQPFEYYEIALEFHALETNQARYEYSATMTDAGPAAGLIRQAKRLDPSFTRQRKARMDILVREVRRGQGVLQWNPKHGRVLRKGLRMRWLVDELRVASR